MDGELEKLGQEYERLDAQADAIRRRIYGDAPVARRNRAPIVERIRGEKKLRAISERLEFLRKQIEELIDVGG